MNYIAHRVNTIDELKAIPSQYGVELDLRDHSDRLILQHDPFKDGEDFEDYLKEYHHGIMILNIKSERIEHRVIELLKIYGISNYFFLDSSFPMIHLLSQKGETKIALRFSEFEGLDTVLNMKGKVEWVWVDCFTKFPLDLKNYQILKENGFKLCMVSPELQGRPEDIETYGKLIKNQKLEFDAICTKVVNIEKWRKLNESL